MAALVVTAAGLAWVFAWALWRGWTGGRAAHLALAALLAAGVAAMAAGAVALQVGAGLGVLLVALRLLMTDRGPGFLTAAAALVAGLLLAAGTPWPGLH